MKRIAIINQRYGLEVNGGSELYTRLIAEHLNKYYDVEVLTTTALDYMTWENYYEPGVSKIHDITVRRFPVEKARKRTKFRIINALSKGLKKTPFNIDEEWIDEQGPYAPSIIEYISDNKETYDCFIFVTYLYYTTAMGLPKVADKSILIPTAHDEPPIYMSYYRQIFTKPKGIVFLTDEEQSFVHQKFHNDDIPNVVTAVGIDLPKEIGESQLNQFKQRKRIDGDYIIYAGRVDRGKGCDEMFEFFLKYKESHRESKIKLVVIGKSVIDIPKHKDIVYLGFVSDEEKYLAIAGAKVLWLPSRFESLSIALLEGMALGIPGLVNGKCDVLKGHAVKSRAAEYYVDYESFEKATDALLLSSTVEYDKMRRRACDYIERYYQWEYVENELQRIIEVVIDDI